MSQAGASDYRPDIDGLRAVAVISVLAFHAFPTAARGGFIGVDIFFVISGFLISSIILRQLEDRKFTLAGFYSRRIMRIFPALLSILIIVPLAVGPLLLVDELRQLAREVAVSSVFGSNILRWLSAGGYFDLRAQTNPMLHLWSLGVEEQFYIVWPVLLWWSWKRRGWPLLAIALAGICSFAFNVFYSRNNPVAAFYSPQSRFWELAIGAALAYLMMIKSTVFASTLQPFRHSISFLGLLLIFLGLLLIREEQTFPGWWALLPTLGTAFAILAGPDAWPNRVLLANKQMVWIGLISYPLYLWHWPLLTLQYVFNGDTPSAVSRMAALLVSIVIAWLTYVAIERPIRFGSQGRLKVPILFVAMGIVGGYGFGLYVSESNEKAVEDVEVRNNEARYVENKYVFSSEKFGVGLTNNECLHMFPQLRNGPAPICRVSRNSYEMIALVGDSHAYSVFGFIDHAAEVNGKGVILLGRGGCAPLLGVDIHGRCAQTMVDVIEIIKENDRIKDVILTAWFAVYANGTELSWWRKASTNRFPLRLVDDPSLIDLHAIFKTGLESAVSELMKNGKKVTVLLDVPEYDFNVRGCLEHRGDRECTVPRQSVNERQKNYSMIVHRLQEQYGFTVIDLKTALCDADTCFSKDGKYLLYIDGHHLNVNGNAFLINQFTNTFLDQFDPGYPSTSVHRQGPDGTPPTMPR